MFSESRMKRSVTPAELLLTFVVLVTIVTVVLPGYSKDAVEARSLVKESDIELIATAYIGIENPEEERPIEVFEKAGFVLVNIVPQLAPETAVEDETAQDDGRIKVPRTVWVYASDLEGLWRDVRSASGETH